MASVAASTTQTASCGAAGSSHRARSARQTATHGPGAGGGKQTGCCGSGGANGVWNLMQSSIATAPCGVMIVQ